MAARLDRRWNVRPLLVTASLLWSFACGGVADPGQHSPEPTRTRVRASDPLHADAPIVVRSRDGAPLPISSLEVRGVIEEPLAMTELHLELENPEPRPTDIDLLVALPRDARLTRFAVWRDGAWLDADVVAREALELEPNLQRSSASELARGSGDYLEVRIPAVPGRSGQKVVVSWVQRLLTPGEPYRVALRGLHTIDRFEARILGPAKGTDVGPGAGEELVRVRRRAFRPDSDLVVQLESDRARGVKHENLVVARVEPLTHDHGEPLHGLVILFDTSASRAVGFERRVARLGEVLDALRQFTGPTPRVRLVAFDQSFETVFEGPLGEFGPRHLEALTARKPLGASNLGAALRIAGLHDDESMDRVLLVSDGIVTAGPHQRTRLREAVAALAEADVRRLDVLVDEGHHDADLLEDLTRALPARGLVIDSREKPRHITRKLLRAVHTDVEIDVPGARWHFPRKVDALQDGDELLVIADVEEPGDSLEVVVRGDIDAVHHPKLHEVERPLVEHAFHQGAVDDLVAALFESDDQTAVYRHKVWRQIVAISRRNRLVNEFTHLRMLGDAVEHASAHLSLEDLPSTLVVGPAGSELRARTRVVLEGDQRPLPRFPTMSLSSRELVLLAEETPEIPDPPAELFARDHARRDSASNEERELVRSLRDDVQLVLEEPLTPDPDARRARRLPDRLGGNPVPAPPRQPSDAYEGNLLAVMNLLAWDKPDAAKAMAWSWREADPEDVMALVALGRTMQAESEFEWAERAYGSIIDLYPHRADMRRFAAGQLDALGTAGHSLAADSYMRAREQHPDHPSSHRLLALSLLRLGREERAFDTLSEGLSREWSDERFTGVEHVLREDLGIVAAAWLRREPERREHITARLREHEVALPTEPSLRFVLSWETAVNDVDLHVRDRYGSHAYYDSRTLGSGGELYFDATRGFGPEVFSLTGTPTGYPYNLQVHYYAKGPLGYGMGKVQIVEHDGQGNVSCEERPFVVMKDRAYVDLGDLTGPLGSSTKGLE